MREALNAFVEEFEALRSRCNGSSMKEVVDDLRLLRADVDTLLECFGGPAAYVEGVETRFNRVSARPQTLEQTILMEDVPEKPVAVSDQAKHEKKRDDTRRRRGNHDSDDSDSSNSSRSSRGSHHSNGSDSSDSSFDDGHRRRSSRSKRSFATQSVIRAREKGRKHSGLKELKCTNPLYKKWVSYRYYRLENSSLDRTPRGTGRVKDCIKRMQLSLRNQSFSGEDPILVLYFLARFVAEADILGLTEGQAFIALPYFMKGLAEDQYNSSAILALRDTRQKSGETETEFSVRLNKAFHRSGNVHSAGERCTMFIDGLDPAIRTLVARYREDRRKTTYLELVQHAQAEGDALRARAPGHRSRTAKALVMEMKSPSLSLVASERPQQEYDNVHFARSDIYSVPTTELPSTTDDSYDTAQDGPLLYADSPRVYGSRIPYSNGALRKSRPGWKDTRQAVKFTDARSGLQPSRPGLICHICYEHGHISPDCILTMRDVAQVIGNYEALTPVEKRIVPMTSYLRAKIDFPRGIPEAKPRNALLYPAEQAPDHRPVPSNPAAGAPLLVVQDPEAPPQADGTQEN
ncbi:unnamed protein product [Agarophyton chilense]